MPAPVSADRVTGVELVVEFVNQVDINLQDDSCPFEVQRFGRTITRSRRQIAAWHQARLTNRPTEAVDNLVKRVSANRPSGDVVG